MLKNLANAFSILFHPFWMPLAGVFIILNHIQLMLVLPDEARKAIYIIVASSTIGLPMLIFPVYLFRNKFKALLMTQRQERYIPLLTMSIFYYFSYHALRNLNAPHILNSFMLGVFISVSIATIVNIWWKISLHAIGLGGILSLLTLILMYRQGHPEVIFFETLIISGIVLTARLYLRQHTLLQIVTGYLCGFITMSVTMTLY